MNILAICSALNNSYAAIKYNDNIYSEIIKSDENYHSLYLIPKLKEIIEKENINLKNLNAITVNCGPGSFTGIRVALSIAKVMAGELNIPIIPLNSAQILLNAYNKDVLVMDARRDLFYIGTKENIILAKKEEINDYTKNKTILSDLRCFETLNNSCCFEKEETDLGKIMLKLAQEKYNNSKDKDEFNYLNCKANYIQTPPVF